MSTSEPSDSTLFWDEPLAKDLQRFLTGRLKCSETAADLTHETYLRLEQRIKKNPPDNARALAFRIALNLAIDYQRKVSVRNRYASSTPFDSALEIASNQSSQPDRTLIAQQQLTALKKALDELPVNCRTAFYMQSVEGLKYAEIASRLGVSKSMVNKLLAQAMIHCAQRLEK
jgi:RNA polymerase sigma-70 factor (ECF subfamily)